MPKNKKPKVPKRWKELANMVEMMKEPTPSRPRQILMHGQRGDVAETAAIEIACCRVVNAPVFASVIRNSQPDEATPDWNDSIYCFNFLTPRDHATIVHALELHVPEMSTDCLHQIFR